ncbi:MAG TPA: hypothetical protein DDW41_04930 [Candidatus Andersenbacteria bacterium]|nr:hypothetical protein [Candidatus Andersenbacteria bacterium]
MKWTQAFQPKKWKVIVSLVPFIFPLFEIWLWIQITFDLYVDVDNFLFDVEEIIGGVLYISEVTISAPFENLLRPLGWWSRNSLVVAPDGPLLPGSFAVAITYSLLIYIIWSLVSLRSSNQKPY